MRRRNRRDQAATAVEYGLFVALIIGLAIAAIIAFGQRVGELFQSVLPF
jgi:Flp pilus assembly pilin Flp